MNSITTAPSASSSVIGTRLAWAVALVAALAFLAYKLLDLHEAFAFGHTRWSEAYTFWFARAHLDLGLSTTLGLNVEGVTGSGEPIFYLSAPPLGGLMQAVAVYSLGGEFWTVRVLPLLFTLINVGLIAVFAYRKSIALAAPLAVMLFLGMPFVLEYGSSNEGHQVYAIAAGLTGYLAYMRFLASGSWGPMVVSAACFALGVGFNWLAGFMALAMLAHLWIQPLSMRIKAKATVLIGVVLGLVVLVLLFQQGMATGDYLYPLKRALERGNVPQDEVVGWGALLELQLSRYWSYFGPVVSVLSAYWLLRRALPKPGWGAADTWAVLIWSPGLVYGLLLRDAAYHHDFLLLGFLPGATLIATLGLIRFIDDVGRVGGKSLAGLAAALLLGMHAAGAVRSAQNFEHQEDEDLKRGGARIALYLKDLAADDILVSDWSASMASRIDGQSKKRYASVLPHIDYLVRRPVRVVNGIEELRDLMCEAGQSGKKLVLLQTQGKSEGTRVRVVDGVEVKKVQVPPEWVTQRDDFDKVAALHLATLPASGCNSENRR